MDIKGLLQVLGRPWLMETTQAQYWAQIAQTMLISKGMSAIPGQDPRSYTGYKNAHDPENMYPEFFRVDVNANMTPQGEVQVIQMKGPLMEDGYCGSAGMNTMENAIKAADADPNIRSIVLWIDSPGGTVSGTHNLSKTVAETAKPVISFVNTMMCSAAYWIGSSADEIVADSAVNGANTMIGSIGTKAVIMDRRGEMEQAGIKLIEVFATKSTRKGKYAADILSGDYTRLIKELDAINDVFLSDVKENRNGKLISSTEDVFQGDTYDVKQSVKLGLIDKMADFGYAVKRSLQLAKTIRA